MPHNTDSLVAVLDIGSNSVRLVFYEYRGNHAQPMFNEKHSCLLGEGVSEGGTLKKEAKEHVLRTIRRFAQLIHARKPNEVIVLATAAIRNARDGSSFAAELTKILGYPITILTGKEEALYAARGVLCTTYQPSGLVVDMGGGSTECAHIMSHGEVDALCSLPMGVLGFTKYYQEHKDEGLARHLTDMLKIVELPEISTLYAVGGSFRAIAKHHMRRHHYPLHVIHDYVLTRDEIEQLLQQMRHDVSKGIRLEAVPRRRYDGIIPALIVLHTLMVQSTASRILFSSGGIREGALMTVHPPKLPYDPLLAMMQAVAVPHSDPHYRCALADWILSVLPCDMHYERLVRAFCWVSDVAMTVHPDYRAEYAFERMISTLGYGLMHNQQVMLALALYHRHRAKLKFKHPALDLLQEHQRCFAFILGQLADMAYGITAGCAHILHDYTPKRDPHTDDVLIQSHVGNDTLLDPILGNRHEELRDAMRLWLKHGKNLSR